MHCEKLISQAEALQKDLSKREAIVQSPLLGFDFFLTLIISQVHIQVRRDCKASNFSRYIILNTMYRLVHLYNDAFEV